MELIKTLLVSEIIVTFYCLDFFFFKLGISRLDFKCQKPSCKEGYCQGISTPVLLTKEIQMKTQGSDKSRKVWKTITKFPYSPEVRLNSGSWWAHFWRQYQVYERERRTLLMNETFTGRTIPPAASERKGKSKRVCDWAAAALGWCHLRVHMEATGPMFLSCLWLSALPRTFKAHNIH